MDPQSAAEKAVAVIGMGYDLTTDIQLSACKVGPNGSRLIQLDQHVKRNLVVPGGVVIPNVPVSIKCDKGERIRFSSDALSFNQMSELVNQGLSLSGKIPSGLFNAMFHFEGCWQKDAADTKVVAFDGWFISLYNVELERSQMALLSEQLRQEIPNGWDPAALARYIKNYGTHIVAGVRVGGKDVIHVKQLQDSNLEPAEVQKLLKELADRKFSEDSLSLNFAKSSGSPKAIYTNRIRCGGIDMGQSHNSWISTISESPNVMSMSFLPITALRSNVVGMGILSHAINLYLRYKPPIEELREFFELQSARQWAPVFNDLPLARYLKNPASPSLQFSFMGPKLFVNTTMVDSLNRPVTGIRLYLEGKNSNHLAIHLQHLASIFPNLQITDDHSCEPPDETLKQGYLKPVRWRMFSHICTAPVEYQCPEIDDSASIVTKAWLEVKSVGMKKVLFLRLGYSTVASARISRSEWNDSICSSPKLGVISTLSTLISTRESKPQEPPAVNINSAVYPDRPPWPTRVPKLTRFVDTKEMIRGPEDPPGHWVVTGAKLCTEGGKIGVKVKYSLFILCSQIRIGSAG